MNEAAGTFIKQIKRHGALFFGNVWPTLFCPCFIVVQDLCRGERLVIKSKPAQNTGPAISYSGEVSDDQLAIKILAGEGKQRTRSDERSVIID